MSGWRLSWGLTGAEGTAAVRALRKKLNVMPVYKMVDTCAAEFESYTPYLYSCYDEEDEAPPTAKKKIMILGSGPNRIGQGIEFDYCCCHAAFALREDGYETIMVNCNPETVSTDYDTSDRLYFEPLTLEDVLGVYEHEASSGAEIGMIVQFGGQTPLNLSLPLKKAGVPIIGTSPESIDLAEDRKRFGKLIEELKIPQPEGAMATSVEEAVAGANRVGYPVLVRPSYVLGGRAMVIAYDDEAVVQYMTTAIEYSQERPVLIDHFLEDAIECDVDALCDGDDVVIAGIMQHIEEAGIHSGDSSCVLPAVDLSEDVLRTIREYTRKLAMALNVRGLVNIQFAIQRGNGVCDRGESAGFAHGALCFEGDGDSAGEDRFAHHGGAEAEGVAAGAGGERQGSGYGVALLCEVAGVSVGQVPGSRYGAWAGDEVDRRGDGSGGQLRRGVCQGADCRGAGASAAGNDLPERERSRQGARWCRWRGSLWRWDFIWWRRMVRRVVLEQAGLQPERVYKVKEGRPNVVDLIKGDRIQLIVNTPRGQETFFDEKAIRRAAVLARIPTITTLAAARAAAEGICGAAERHVERDCAADAALGPGCG